jgi:hypothetical protein
MRLRFRRADQYKRLLLEQRLSVSDETHHKELSDAQKGQGPLCDRLATFDLRFSVLIYAAYPTGGCSVPPAPSTGVVVHVGIRARLTPVHAQRIVVITDSGDQELIALAASQASVRAIAPNIK